MTDKAKVARFVQAGMSYRQVAEHLNLTRNQVAGIVFRKKNPDAARIRYEEDKNDPDFVQRRRARSRAYYWKNRKKILQTQRAGRSAVKKITAPLRA